MDGEGVACADDESGEAVVTATLAAADGRKRAAVPLEEGPEGFPIGAMLDCQWRTGVWYPGEIVEKRANQEGGGWMYYIHYVGFNKRLDEWLTPDRLNPKIPHAPPRKAAREKESGRKMTRSKRKADSLNDLNQGPAAEGEEHKKSAGELEHEEVTKMKNINVIQLG